MIVGTIAITTHKPPLMTRLAWHLLQIRLHILRPSRGSLTTEEWYAADCPPPGQRKPWGL